MTATQPDSASSTPRRRRFSKKRARRLTITLSAFLLLLSGGYIAAALTVALPELEPQPIVPVAYDFSVEVDAGNEALTSQSLPSAVGWATDPSEWAYSDQTIWANSDDAHPIASLTKLVTVIVCLEAEPVDEGTDGGTYTVTEADANTRAQVLGMNGIAHDTPVGLELTTRQLLELILLPSSNNYAIAYANSVFGSQRAFASAANEWAAEHGLSSVQIVEASGLSENNVASPADVVRFTRLALDHPLIAEVIAMESAEIPEIGLIESTNPLIEDDGVIGAKTGTLFESGYNLSAVRVNTVEGREVTTIAATLSRDGAAERARDTRVVLNDALATITPMDIVVPADPVGTVLTWEGREVSILTDGEASTVLLPGEAITRNIELDRTTGARAQGTVIGAIMADTPTGAAEVPVITDAAIVEPDGWWRLANPGIVFGWKDPEPRPELAG